MSAEQLADDDFVSQSDNIQHQSLHELPHSTFVTRPSIISDMEKLTPTIHLSIQTNLTFG
jgi:hypothetical protein